MFAGYAGEIHDCSESVVNSKALVSDSVKYFSEIVDFSYKNNIELIIYFSPIHARLYEAQCIMGQWGRIYNLKHAVLDIVKIKSQKYNADSFPVWDFTGYNYYTTEVVPAYGDTESSMTWYWE